ncbi:uncharacterized protein K452DRAFT_282590 [Aplosporella prunicola CBS 121167]|uniref:Uncharacterized protein n=1 Tax=Aplosporella prunicola CBS 121167 TaxID=1176127 RepID=A0A6A6BXK8_9PEZI|nr:uncharacterized protein K452DRAFT_282590 [Aplosporella prunicola CBS 121167]KAF2147594.1 hypothetical protein K452DRAFT_282590 [Aplosporella prunicola CBS 121167]
MTPKNNETDRITERVIAEWDDVKAGKPRFLGNTKDTSFQMTMRLDTHSKPELLLWFHIVVRVKHHWHSHNPRSKTLFFVIQADMFDFALEQGCFMTQPVTDLRLLPPTICALSEANLGPLDAIYRLRFKLKTCGNVLMPRTDTPFFPASDKARDLLQGLQSLSQAKDFCIYIPLKDKNFLSMDKKEVPCDLAAKQLCELVATKQMVTHKIDFESAYKDGAQWNVWKNFDLKTACQKPKAKKKVVEAEEAGPSTAFSVAVQQEHQTASEEVVEPFAALPPGYDEATSTNNPDRTRPDGQSAAAPGAQNARRAWMQLGLDLDGEETEAEEATEVPAPTVETRQHEDAVPAVAATTVPVVHAAHATVSAAAPATSPAARSAETSPGATAGEDRQNKRKPRNSPSEEDVEPSDVGEETRAPRRRARKQVRFHDTAEQLPHWMRAHQRSQPTASHVARSALRPLTPGSTPAMLRKELAKFIVWLMDVNVELEEVYEDVLWTLGKAAGAGDEKEFQRIRARCKADVFCRYKRKEA